MLDFDVQVIGYSLADPGPPEPWPLLESYIQMMDRPGVHFSAAPAPPPAPHPVPATIRLRPSALPPLSPWSADDAPGFSDAKALQAIQWIVQGYPKAEIARALGVSRATISNFSTGRIWRHVPWPLGHQPVRGGARRSSLAPCEVVPPRTGQEHTSPAA